MTHKINFGANNVLIKGVVNGETIIAFSTYIDSVESDLSAEDIKLNTGAYRFPVESVRGRSSGTVTLNLRNFDANLLKLLAPQKDGESFEHLLADAGSVSNIAGLDATAGVASITLTTPADGKYGSYWGKWITATTLKIYCDNNLSLDVTDESGLVEEGLTITDGGDTVWNGLTFTGGTAVAGVVGEILSFSVRPPSVEFFKQHFGKSGEEMIPLEVHVFGEKINNKIQKTTYYKCKSNGNVVPKNTQMEFGALEITLSIMQDTTRQEAVTTEFIQLA